MLWTSQLAVFLYQAPVFLQCTTLHLTLTAERIWVSTAVVEQTPQGYVSQSAERKAWYQDLWRLITAWRVSVRLVSSSMSTTTAPTNTTAVGPTSSGRDEFKIKISFLLNCLFERSEFLIRTLQKKRLCVCVCVPFLTWF